MPIKYQMLGGGGGGKRTDVIINTLPNSSVTLSNTEYRKTLQANGKGEALFKGLKAGVYTAVSKPSNGATYQKNIYIPEQQEEYLLERKMIKDLPIGSKIKFSSGKKFFLTGKNITSKNKPEVSHDLGSATFMAEYIYGNSTWEDRTPYRDTEIHKTIMPSFYNELSEKEKNAMIEREFYTQETGTSSSTYSLKSYFLLPSATELDENRIKYPLYDTEGAHIFEPANQAYYITYENGETGNFFTRSFDIPPSPGAQNGIYYNRGVYRNVILTGLPQTMGIVPICDLSGFVWVSQDVDGYWKII